MPELTQQLAKHYEEQRKAIAEVPRWLKRTKPTSENEAVLANLNRKSPYPSQIVRTEYRRLFPVKTDFCHDPKDVIAIRNDYWQRQYSEAMRQFICGENYKPVLEIGNHHNINNPYGYSSCKI